MLGTMMLPTVVRDSRQQEEEEDESVQTTDQPDGSVGGVASPAHSSNSEDSTGPMPCPPSSLDLGRKNPYPMPSRLHDPLDFDLDLSNNNLIAARPTVPRLYNSYSSKRKDVKGEMAGLRGPRLSRLLTTDQLEELERTYLTDPYPDYFQLGIKIGLKSHQVRHWFQTRRKSNRNKRPKTESDEALMDEYAAEEEVINTKYGDETANVLEQEVRDFSRKRKHFNPPHLRNGHTPPSSLPKTARLPPAALDIPPAHDIGPLNYNMASLPKAMTPVSAPLAHTNGMTNHPNATAASIYRMMSSQAPTHRQASIPPNVNVALHPAFGMQWQLPTPTVENLLEKGDLEVLVEQRDFLRNMLEQQEALRFMWDQQISTLKRLLNVCEMKISRERSRDHKQVPKQTRQPIQKAHSNTARMPIGIPQPTSAIVSPIISTRVSSDVVRSLLTTHSDVIAPMPPLLATGLGTPRSNSGPLKNTNCHSKIVTPMYGGVAIDLRSDLTSTSSPTPNSSRRQSRDDVDSHIEADMSENEVQDARGPLELTVPRQTTMRALSDEETEMDASLTPPSSGSTSLGNMDLHSDPDTPISSVAGEKLSPDELFPPLPLPLTSDADDMKSIDLSLSLDDTFDMYTRITSDAKSRIYSCTLCEKSFSSRSNLRAHFRTHTGEKPFFCTFCGRRFAQRSTLRTHKRIHTGDMPYKCNHCNRAFRDYSTLSKHARTHTGDRPYACQICGRAFAQSGNLQRHIKHTHPRAYVPPGSTSVRAEVPRWKQDSPTIEAASEPTSIDLSMTGSHQAEQQGLGRATDLRKVIP